MSDKIITENTDEIVCPYCGYRCEDDNDEVIEFERDMNCEECGKRFIYEGCVTVTYSSKKIDVDKEKNLVVESKQELVGISYDGAYPNLCHGTLTVVTNKSTYKIEGCMISGGFCSFNEEFEECVEYGPWCVDINELPDEIKHLHEQIEDEVNRTVDYGCCGGCL